jgi:hypothetical protein
MRFCGTQRKNHHIGLWSGFDIRQRAGSKVPGVGCRHFRFLGKGSENGDLGVEVYSAARL